MLIAVVVFLFFNARKKAVVFAGDVGSISLAFILAWFIIKLIVVYSKLFYILLFSVYAIDSVITIVYRIKRRENILKPHRTHLYQYLANEMGWPHLKVTAIYAMTQLVVNLIGIYLIRSGIMNWWLFVSLAAFLTLGYLIIRMKVLRIVDKQKSTRIN